MKKLAIYIVCLLVLAMTGCGKTILESPKDGGVDPTLVNVDLTFETDPSIEPYTSSRSETANAGEHDTRWIIEVFRDEINGTPTARRVLCCNPAVDGKHTISTSLPLHAAKYYIVTWMDYVQDGTLKDKYYTVNSLASISIPETKAYTGNNDYKDTYVARQELDLTGYRKQWNATVKQTVTLQRPMAKIEFITTDLDKFLDKLSEQLSKTGTTADNKLSRTPALSTIRVEMEYTCYFPCGFNAYTNKPNDARLGVAFSSNIIRLSEKEGHLASDYIFVNGTESAVTVKLTIRDSEGVVLNEIGGINVPIARGKLTTIRDEFLTRSYSPGIGIDPDFDGEIDIVIPD